MGTFESQILATLAFAKVTGTDGTVITNRGFATITRTGTGVYTLLREAGMTGVSLPVAELALALCLHGTAAKMGTATDDGAGTTTVRTFNDSGTASDTDFTLHVKRDTNHE